MNSTGIGSPPPGGGQTSFAEGSQNRKTKPQSPGTSSVSDVSAGTRGGFVVNFECFLLNTQELANLMESVGASVTRISLSGNTKEVIFQLLRRIDSIIVSLQKSEIPEVALTKTLVKKVEDNVLKNRRVPMDLKASVQKLLVAFLYCQHFDYYMYGSVDQKLCHNLAKFLSIIPEYEPLEVMAGAGWLHKGLKAQDIQIRSTDNYGIIASDSYIGTRNAEIIFNDCGMRENNSNFAVKEGATVEKIDAITALEGSSSRIVLISWPDPRGVAAIYQILDHCYKNEKLIIYIGPEAESLSTIVIKAGHQAEKDCFIPVKGAPACHAYPEWIRVGFWKEEPEWWSEALKRQHRKESRPDFMVRHFVVP